MPATKKPVVKKKPVIKKPVAKKKPVGFAAPKDKGFFTVQMPNALRERIRRVTKLYHMDQSKFARAAIIDALNQLDPDGADTSAQEINTV